jgi:glycine betaine/proline transport system ATP-binding protein
VTETTALRFSHVDVLFPRASGRRGAHDVAAALAACDRGASRTDVLSGHDVMVAVRDVTLDVPRGLITVLVGPSGSGKSTLLRTANGLTPITRGSLQIADAEGLVDIASCDPLRLRELRRRRVSMVFQQFALLPSRSVRDNVALGLELRGESREVRQQTVTRVLDLVGLEGWGDRPVRELSGGMQQRVGLARALATDADVLLMDEPFSALDAVMRRRLQDELRTLQAQLHKTILFVTHDLEEAAWLGDRLAVLHDGRLVQQGTSAEVMSSPATPEVEELVRCARPR